MRLALHGSNRCHLHLNHSFNPTLKLKDLYSLLLSRRPSTDLAFLFVLDVISPPRMFLPPGFPFVFPWVKHEGFPICVWGKVHPCTQHPCIDLWSVSDNQKSSLLHCSFQASPPRAQNESYILLRIFLPELHLSSL